MSEPPGGAVPSIAAIVAALVRAKEQSSLHRVALQVGLSASGLRKVIEGTRTQGRTDAKLREWYLRYAPAVLGPSEEVAAAVLGFLVEPLAESNRGPARIAVLGVLESFLHEEGKAPPHWLEALRRRRG